MIGWYRTSKFKSVLHLTWTLVLLLIVIFGFWTYRQQIFAWLSVTGSTGIIRSIVAMTIFCIIPVPAEVMMIENLRANGNWIGTGVNFTGAFLGAEILFLTARFIRRRIVHLYMRQTTYQKFSLERNRHKMIGLLLLARILPIPAKMVDLSAGIVKTISWWDFTWTTAIGIIPYQLLALFFYHGWQTHSLKVLIAVFIIVSICILIWFRIPRR